MWVLANIFRPIQFLHIAWVALNYHKPSISTSMPANASGTMYPYIMLSMQLEAFLLSLSFDRLVARLYVHKKHQVFTVPPEAGLYTLIWEFYASWYREPSDLHSLNIPDNFPSNLTYSWYTSFANVWLSTLIREYIYTAGSFHAINHSFGQWY